MNPADRCGTNRRPKSPFPPMSEPERFALDQLSAAGDGAEFRQVRGTHGPFCLWVGNVPVPNVIVEALDIVRLRNRGFLVPADSAAQTRPRVHEWRITGEYTLGDGGGK